MCRHIKAHTAVFFFHLLCALKKWRGHKIHKLTLIFPEKYENGCKSVNIKNLNCNMVRMSNQEDIFIINHLINLLFHTLYGIFLKRRIYRNWWLIRIVKIFCTNTWNWTYLNVYVQQKGIFSYKSTQFF